MILEKTPAIFPRISPKLIDAMLLKRPEIIDFTFSNAGPRFPAAFTRSSPIFEKAVPIALNTTGAFAITNGFIAAYALARPFFTLVSAGEALAPSFVKAVVIFGKILEPMFASLIFLTNSTSLSLTVSRDGNISVSFCLRKSKAPESFSPTNEAP